MCGIAGIIGQQDRQAIEKMVGAMHHRGPDDKGTFHAENVSLGMSRLSIIDTSLGGHQPMSNKKKDIWIVYNGEMYNFKEEREILTKKGHTFTSNSDTEVVLKMYEVYDKDFLQRLRGMFAFAIYDQRPNHKEILLARDQIGVKPLLYAKMNNSFIFGSEIKSLLASGMVPREINPESLRQLVTFGSVVQPNSMLKGVQMLLPGHYIVVKKNSFTVKSYWHLSDSRYPELATMGYEEQTDFVAKVLQDTVSKQMISDVPLGAFLSSGVDSSLLVALMAKMVNQPIRTFTIQYTDATENIDESGTANATAKFLGTNHSTVQISDQEIHAEIRRIAWGLDQPTVDGTNAYLISKVASQNLRVAISGTGGDEIFAGYPWFIHMLLAEKADKENLWRSLAGKVVAATLRNSIFDSFMLRRRSDYIHGLRNAYGFLSRYSKNYQIFGPLSAATILSKEFASTSRTGRAEAFDLSGADQLPNAAAVERTSAICLRTYTQNQLLRDIDAAAMANSLEIRVPYLDHVLTDVALSLPSTSKLHSPEILRKLQEPAFGTYKQTGAKRIMFELGKNLLPQHLNEQKKKGFALPFERWLKGTLRETLLETLSTQCVSKRGWFNPVEVSELKKNFLQGKGHWTRPWLIMMTELWAQEVLDK